MADVNRAIEFMLRQEDCRLAGTITHESGDHGGMTRFGLCAKWHPALVAAGFFDPTRMSYEAALMLAEQTYAEEYARPLRLAELHSDAVACAVLSFAVNDGLGAALMLMRRAMVALGCEIPATARFMDDATFEAEQHCEESALVPALVKQQQAHYAAILARDPAQKKFYAGWINRTNQVLALVRARPA